MQRLGELTAAGMEAFHKTGELLLIQEEADPNRHTHRAKALNRFKINFSSIFIFL